MRELSQNEFVKKLEKTKKEKNNLKEKKRRLKEEKESLENEKNRLYGEVKNLKTAVFNCTSSPVKTQGFTPTKGSKFCHFGRSNNRNERGLTKKQSSGKSQIAFLGGKLVHSSGRVHFGPVVFQMSSAGTEKKMRQLSFSKGRMKKIGALEEGKLSLSQGTCTSL